MTATTAEPPVVLTPAIPPEPVLPLSVEQYHEMTRAGIFDSGAPFELLEGIPVYWIVDLVDRQVEVFTEPTGPCQRPNYAVTDVYRAGQTVPVVLDGQLLGKIAVDEILP